MNIQLSKGDDIGRLLRRDNGVPLSYVGMFVDVTDRKNPSLSERISG